jgi:uncharacterized protein (DUF362 family)
MSPILDQNIVSIVRYEKPLESVRRAVELSRGLANIPARAKVFIKPNIVFWSRTTPFPKWGVITTSRVVEDMVILLKERGIDDLTIGEGMVTYRPNDRETPAHAFESLGYNILTRRYGVKCVDIHQRPFEEVDLGEGIGLSFNTDFLHSDFVVNIPVLKTHAQTVVSLGIKNIKGVLDINSRKKCHSADPEKDLNYMVARLPRVLPQGFTILDGIYTNERGPSFDGKIRRGNILVASQDILSADMVGAKILGYEVSAVPHLAYVTRGAGRPDDLSDVSVVGERIEAVASRHEYMFPYTDDGSLPTPMKRMGIQGLSFRKYDSTLCTYCSFLNGQILTEIALAWKGRPWDDIEVLTGKAMRPTPGKKKTILIGKCIYQANKEDPNINEMLAIKGCPPSTKAIVNAFHSAGIPIAPTILEQIDKMPGLFMKKYQGRPDFDESLFRIT